VDTAQLSPRDRNRIIIYVAPSTNLLGARAGDACFLCASGSTRGRSNANNTGGSESSIPKISTDLLRREVNLIHNPKRGSGGCAVDLEDGSWYLKTAVRVAAVEQRGSRKVVFHKLGLVLTLPLAVADTSSRRLLAEVSHCAAVEPTLSTLLPTIW
jgi:hypothetical protein